VVLLLVKTCYFRLVREVNHSSTKTSLQLVWLQHLLQEVQKDLRELVVLGLGQLECQRDSYRLLAFEGHQRVNYLQMTLLHSFKVQVLEYLELRKVKLECLQSKKDWTYYFA
jgi:hypothetical protein